MKKRLRKKRHLGEFAEWGRKLIVARTTKLNAGEFHDAFIIDAIEKNGCFCGGSLSDDKIDVVVELGRMSEDPEKKFSDITAWLDERSDVKEWKAGPLFDLWHGDFENIEL